MFNAFTQSTQIAMSLLDGPPGEFAKGQEPQYLFGSVARATQSRRDTEDSEPKRRKRQTQDIPQAVQELLLVLRA